jgi:hypothetical protein
MELRRANAELEAQQKVDRVAEAYRQSLEQIAAKEEEFKKEREIAAATYQ